MHIKYIDSFIASSEIIAKRYRTKKQAAIVVPNYPQLAMAPAVNLGARAPIIVYQGQISAERGIVHLIKAFKGVVESIPEARLEIMGPERLPGTYQQIETILDRYKLKDKVTLHGILPHKKVIQLLQGSAIGVIPFINHPSYHVAVPIKLFEYMLAGCAVVASDLTVIRNLGKDAVEYVEPEDVLALESSLIMILNDAQLRTELAERGRALIENGYRWDYVAPRLLEVVEQFA